MAWVGEVMYTLDVGRRGDALTSLDMGRRCCILTGMGTRDGVLTDIGQEMRCTDCTWAETVSILTGQG